MKRQRIQQIGTLVFLGVAFAAGVSCTGTDFNDSGTAQVAFETAAVNQASLDYECVLLRISGLHVRPLEPSAAKTIGNASLSIVPQSLLVNFSGEACSQPSQTLPNFTLSEGVYEIIALQLGSTGTQIPAMLFDQESGTLLRCFSGPVDVVASFPQPLVVREGQPIRLVIDRQQFESFLRPSADNFSCQDLFDHITDVLEFQ